jgi:hypothetical protein
MARRELTGGEGYATPGTRPQGHQGLNPLFK